MLIATHIRRARRNGPKNHQHAVVRHFSFFVVILIGLLCLKLRLFLRLLLDFPLPHCFLSLGDLWRCD